MMAAGAIDVCNYDASWGGGPTEWRRIAALAAAFDVQLGHHEEAQVAAHLLASQPHATYVEAFAPARDPIFWGMIENRPALVDGALPLPEGPGLGWVLDETFIERAAPIVDGQPPGRRLRASDGRSRGCATRRPDHDRAARGG